LVFLEAPDRYYKLPKLTNSENTIQNKLYIAIDKMQLLLFYISKSKHFLRDYLSLKNERVLLTVRSYSYLTFSFNTK